MKLKIIMMVLFLLTLVSCDDLEPESDNKAISRYAENYEIIPELRYNPGKYVNYVRVYTLKHKETKEEYILVISGEGAAITKKGGKLF